MVAGISWDANRATEIAIERDEKAVIPNIIAHTGKISNQENENKVEMSLKVINMTDGRHIFA